VVGFFRSSGTYLLVRPQAPWKTLQDFIDAAKKEPGKLTFGYFNASSRTPPEYLARLAKIELQAIPYRAIANAVADLMSGEISCLFIDTTASAQYIQNSQLRPIAITRQTRAKQTPDVPTVAETFPGFSLTGFLGVAVPAGTPRDVSEKLNALINQALGVADVQRRMDEFGLSYDPMTIAQCEEEVRAERERWVEYTRVAGIQPEWPARRLTHLIVDQQFKIPAHLFLHIKSGLARGPLVRPADAAGYGPVGIGVLDGAHRQILHIVAAAMFLDLRKRDLFQLKQRQCRFHASSPPKERDRRRLWLLDDGKRA
jgi:hypothetical protein